MKPTLEDVLLLGPLTVNHRELSRIAIAAFDDGGFHDSQGCEIDDAHLTLRRSVTNNRFRSGERIKPVDASGTGMKPMTFWLGISNPAGRGAGYVERQAVR